MHRARLGDGLGRMMRVHNPAWWMLHWHLAFLFWKLTKRRMGTIMVSRVEHPHGVRMYSLRVVEE